MIRVTQEQVFKKMQSDQLMYWRVLDGRQLIDQCMDAASVEDSLEQLRLLLNQCEGNVVTVILSNKNNAEKAKGGRNYINYEYSVKLRNTTDYSGSNSLLRELMDLKLQMQINELKKHHEEELRKITEEKQSGPLDKALEVLLPLIQQQLMATTKPGIAGIVNEPVAEERLGISKKEELIQALNVLKANDSDYIDTIKALSKIALDYPEKYKMYKPMLMNLSNG
jgi:hypothetical protein